MRGNLARRRVLGHAQAAAQVDLEEDGGGVDELLIRVEESVSGVLFLFSQGLAHADDRFVRRGR